MISPGRMCSVPGPRRITPVTGLRSCSLIEVESGSDGAVVSTTRYRKMTPLPANCTFDPVKSAKKINQVRVTSRKFELGLNQIRSMRRHCCDVLRPASNDTKIEVQIRECKEDELTYMH